MSRNTLKKHVDLHLIEGKYKKHYVFIKDFNTFMYIHTLHCEKKHCCCYCLQTFKGKKILKPHINKRFKINGKQMIQMPKEGE